MLNNICDIHKSVPIFLLWIITIIPLSFCQFIFLRAFEIYRLLEIDILNVWYRCDYFCVKYIALLNTGLCKFKQINPGILKEHLLKMTLSVDIIIKNGIITEIIFKKQLLYRQFLWYWKYQCKSWFIYYSELLFDVLTVWNLIC